ncbi:MAG: tRNA uridine-5-carboxymethylaminomethyl(34) synthesis GTPase MnmE [Alistipes sp.]|nr:tRNA uridine-5-carboxymethylaminomethyl(34) synthesis GTPase MnmE [Alistipes sp.]
MIFQDTDTIVAPATAIGGALCVIRISGDKAISVCDSIFKGRKSLRDAKTATLHYGNIMDNDEVVDDVVVSIFRAPHSYTGEDSVEISVHGSRYIVQRVITLLTQHGARLAQAGEFTRRAFLAGKMDLSQAEAVADMIAASSHASHAIASTQMRGAYSDELRTLRDKLLHIASLLELELDFSEEDVEFADREELRQLLQTLRERVSSLAKTFSLGNALKEGVMVAIAGRPNVGKSTLLNRLAGEDRAMVSDIAGTTRDTIEITTNIDGVIYRFIDTAGLHSTDDKLERMGIERTEQALRKARIILWMQEVGDGAELGFTPTKEQKLIRIINKIDLVGDKSLNCPSDDIPTLYLSAKSGEGVEKLIEMFKSITNASAAYQGEVIVSSQRHYEALTQASEALHSALTALDTGISSDLLSEDIRQVMYHLGGITGEITNSEILQSIFSRFCVGK